MRDPSRTLGATRRTAAVLLAALACLATTAGAVVASGDSKRSAPASVVGADVITHVFPEIGHRVVAVSLELDRPVQLRPGSADARSAFTVEVSLPGATGARMVTDAYSNDRPALGSDDSRAVAGRYLIIELRAEDENASVNYGTADGANAPHQLIGAYSVSQTADVRDNRGVVLPARPFAVTNDGVVNPVVDDFARMRFTDAAGTSLDYRFFQPRRERSSRRYPLVLFLHGGGETASPLATPNNIVQITANRGAIVWATPERQARHPAYVVAPQLPARDSQWTAPAIQNAVIALVDEIAARYPIDRNRLYLTGLARRSRRRRGRVRISRQIRGRAARRCPRRGRRRVPSPPDGAGAALGLRMRPTIRPCRTARR